MTNAQKWVAAFLGLFILLFFLSKLFEDDEIIVPEEIDNYAQDETQEVAEEVTGLTLIQRNGCIACHGDNLKGKSRLGPSLYNAKQHWDRDGLINYLRNPGDFSNDSRFDDYSDEFSNIMMPSYDNLEVKDLGKMADYILSLKEK